MANDLIVLTAPPASGKTFWMESFARELSSQLLFISPLRALAEECKLRSKTNYLIMTPEEWLKKRPQAQVVVIDEFHLFFYWGDSFRHLMWEAFYELVSDADLVILLTATLSSEMKNEISLFESQFKNIWWIDQGNQKLKYCPQKYYKIPSLSLMEDLIFSIPPKRGRTSLIFCCYRREVSMWEKKLKSCGYHVLSCVGGEAREFSEKLRLSPHPDFIIATSVLSHGVNLPGLGKIFFTYQVKDQNFWIQMVARGGRKGDSYEVYSLEKPFGLKWNIFFNFLAIQKLSLKIKWLKLYKQIEEWFLKAL